MNGHVRFVFVKRCGCVLAESVLKQFDSQCCLVCNKEYDHFKDIIVINGRPDDVEELQKRLQKVDTKKRKIPKDLSLNTTVTNSQQLPFTNNDDKELTTSDELKQKLIRMAPELEKKLVDLKSIDSIRSMYERKPSTTKLSTFYQGTFRR